MAIERSDEIVSANISWRFILDDESSPAWNMAVDEAILDGVAEGISPPTVRLYRWDQPSITVGRFQVIENGVDVAYCRAVGIPIVRRPTGGRGILHDGDQTVSVVVSASSLGSTGRKVIESYRFLSSGIMSGLASLGFPVRFGECEKASRGGDCYSSRSKTDILLPDSSKIVGSAQRRRNRFILQQSSIRHLQSTINAEQVFIGPVSSYNGLLRHIETDRLIDSLIQGYQSILGKRMFQGSLNAWELERSGVLLSRYPNQAALVDTDLCL